MQTALLMIAAFLALGFGPMLFGYGRFDLAIAFALAIAAALIITPRPGSASTIGGKGRIAAVTLTLFGLMSALWWISASRDFYRSRFEQMQGLCRTGLDRYGKPAEQGPPFIRYFPRVADSSGDPILAAFSRHCELHSLEYVRSFLVEIRGLRGEP
jgi:hypothetical protein